ncbi:MAG: hypothetical protein ABW067_15590, partial [Rhizobacter sp.]
IWVSGAVTSQDETKLAELRRSPLSGDWRNIGGRLELVAALAVNTPGFPVPRARTKAGKSLALVAAGALHSEEHEDGDSGGNAQYVDHSTLAVDVARTMRRMDRADRVAATVGGAFASADRVGRAFAAAQLLQGRKG